MIEFVDISDWQSEYNVESDPYPLIVIKASEGANYVNPSMPAHRQAAHDAGKYVGLYHFMRNTGQAEIDAFKRAVGTLGPREFAVCDWELPANPAQTASPEQVLQWLTDIESWSRRTPWLYSYGPFLAARPTAALTRFPLWIASYTDEADVHTDRWQPWSDGPGYFPHAGRTVAWQYTDSGPRGVDQSRSFLTFPQLAAITATAPTEPPQPLLIDPEEPEMWLFNLPDTLADGSPGGGTYITDGDRAWGVPDGSWLDVFFFGTDGGGHKSSGLGKAGPFAERHLGVIPEKLFWTFRGRDGTPRVRP